jgi:ATPase subunit of ABC transporter with duplicated ATPase domains
MQIEALIREGQPAMLFVEHDRAFIENAATRVIEL